MCIYHDLRKCKALKPLATIHFAKWATKKIIGRFPFVSNSFEPQDQPVFVPGTKTKLRARGFKIVCEFVPNAYVETHGGIRRQDGRADDPTGIDWNDVAAYERERVGIAGTGF